MKARKERRRKEERMKERKKGRDGGRMEGSEREGGRKGGREDGSGRKEEYGNCKEKIIPMETIIQYLVTSSTGILSVGAGIVKDTRDLEQDGRILIVEKIAMWNQRMGLRLQSRLPHVLILCWSKRCASSWLQLRAPS